MKQEPTTYVSRGNRFLFREASVSIENLVILELIKQNLNKGIEPSIYYYRDSNNHEVDVILKDGRELTPIEIKSSQTFNTRYLKEVKYFAQIAGEQVKTGYVIYSGLQEQQLGNFFLLNYQNIMQVLNCH